MSDEGQNPPLALVVKRFKHAAIALHYGYEDEDEAMQLAGIDGLNRAIENLDAFGTEARSALIPLLEDSDQVVRALAARDLLTVMPERALAILRNIYLAGPMQARLVASSILERHERGELKI
jgi:hypothetical protein